LNAIHSSTAKISSVSNAWGDIYDGSMNGSFTSTHTVDIPSGWSTDGQYKMHLEGTMKFEGDDVAMKSNADVTIKIVKQQEPLQRDR